MSGAGSEIIDSTASSAGDHVHLTSCTPLEADEGVGDWSDGITFVGPGHVVTGNTIINASDVGIVFFGGRNTVITENIIKITPGNHGMFAGIGLHGWIFGDISGTRVTANQVISEGDSICGGTHTGINLGAHMWGAGCISSAHPLSIGHSSLCQANPAPPSGSLCIAGQPCQEWATVAAGFSLFLQDNYVAGAQVNYLIEGLDLMGSLVETNNTNGLPLMSDWEFAKNGCSQGGVIDTWGTFNKVAHDPIIADWIDQRIHCER